MNKRNVTTTTAPPVLSTRRRLQHTFSRGTWFMLPRSFMFFLSLHESAVLAYLINVAESVQAEERNNGWFYCTTVRITRDINISKSAQVKAFKKLSSMKFVTTKWSGNPAKRSIRLEYEEIEKYVNRAIAAFFNADENAAQSE
jgi:GR25 family glycosyltransferase involved in LPS biosynthesis